MDIATVIGLGLVVAAIIGAILAGGDITAFIDVPCSCCWTWSYRGNIY